MSDGFLTQAIEFDNALGQAKAREALEILMQAYPGYSWKVTVKGGVCFVRLLDPDLRGNWGMNLKLRAIDHDAAVFKRKVKYVAGEFLERCNLRRLSNEGAKIARVDGIPERFQPQRIFHVPREIEKTGSP
jgi:hypothetical protein